MFSIVLFDKRLHNGYRINNFETMREAFSFFKKARARFIDADLWYNPDRISMEDVLYLPSSAWLLNQC